MASSRARKELRELGGILSSSDELIRAAEESLSGRTFAPGYDLQTPAMRSAVREEGLDYPSFELLRRTTPSRQTMRTLGYPESAVGGSMYYDRILAGLGLADRSKKMPPMYDMYAERFRTQPVVPTAVAEPLATDALVDGPVNPQMRGLFDPTAVSESGAKAVVQKLEKEAERKTLGSEDQQRLKDAKETLAAIRINKGLSQRDEDILMGQEVISDERRAELETARQNQPRFDPLAPTKREPGPDANVTGVGKGDLAPEELVRKIVTATDKQLYGPEPETKKDLRARYNENMALFKEIYGVDDEDRARDKMMMLAMIGLSIAAGQSPDALTNIAQGALTGLKMYTQTEQERRQEQRDLRTAALEAAMSSEAAAADAEARAAGKAYDRETQMIVQAMKNEAKDTEVAEKFLKMTPPGRAFLEASKTIEDSISQQTGVHYDAVRDIEKDPAAVRRYINQQALQAIAPAFSPEELALVRVPLGEAAVTVAPDAGVEKMIATQRAAGATDDQIRKMLEEAGKNGEAKFNPALYGL